MSVPLGIDRSKHWPYSADKRNRCFEKPTCFWNIGPDNYRALTGQFLPFRKRPMFDIER
jgi:hypothetical protein